MIAKNMNGPGSNFSVLRCILALIEVLVIINGKIKLHILIFAEVFLALKRFEICSLSRD